MPRSVQICLVVLLLLLAAVPFALIARARSTTSQDAPVHVILDMDKQAKYTAQRESTLFADGRAMRPPVAGTLAREDWQHKIDKDRTMLPTAQPLVEIDLSQATPEIQDRVLLGQHKQGEKAVWETEIPIPVTRELMNRGQERYTIYCAPCHGNSGYGDGAVQRRVDRLRATNPAAIGLWVAPANLHDPRLQAAPVGQLYNTITNGKNSMPRYDSQIAVPDRWAIVAYMRALQRSQNAKIDDLPADQRNELK